MKKIIIKSFLSLLVFTLLIACDDNDDFNDVTTDPLLVNTDALSGTWTLNTVVQVDQDAVDNGFPENVQRMDITSMFNWSETTITFTLDNEGSAQSFTLDAGSAPNYLITSGEWSIDHPVFTSVIDLTNAAEDTSSRLVIEEITENELKGRIERISVDDVVFIRYDVVFVK